MHSTYVPTVINVQSRFSANMDVPLETIIAPAIIDGGAYERRADGGLWRQFRYRVIIACLSSRSTVRPAVSLTLDERQHSASRNVADRPIRLSPLETGPAGTGARISCRGAPGEIILITNYEVSQASGAISQRLAPETSWTGANEASWTGAKEFGCIFPFITARSIFGSAVSREFVARWYFKTGPEADVCRGDRSNASTPGER